MLLQTTNSPVLDWITVAFVMWLILFVFFLLYPALGMIVALAIIGTAILTIVILIIALLCRIRRERTKRKHETA